MNDKESSIRLLAEILRKIGNLPSDPFRNRDALQGRYPFPIWLDLGNEQVIYITPEISEMLARFSKIVMEVFFQSRKSEFTNSEWNQIVKQAFGAALGNHNEANISEEGTETILAGVKKTIHDRICAIHEREYAFGCHFCNIPDLKPLSIGTVRFEPRFAWLARIQDQGGVSKISRSRIERAWQGEQLRRRKPSDDEHRERKILDAIGKSDFVCSITVGPMGSEAGLQKALIAARLATTAIALGWAKPSSALDFVTLIFDRQPHLKNYLVFSPDKSSFGWGSSWSYGPGGVTWLNAKEWEELRSDFCEIFDCAGEAIRYVTHGHNEVVRPEMMGVLFQALLWFHEGCRETVDLMAIVKFCSSMEALACGREKKGILDLIKIRLCIEDIGKLRKEVEKLYSAGRSRTVHGTNNQLGHDWRSYRNLAEHLARWCLISCLQWAAEHRESDDPSLFSKSKT